jgi:hypothetical protein
MYQNMEKNRGCQHNKRQIIKAKGTLRIIYCTYTVSVEGIHLN